MMTLSDGNWKAKEVREQLRNVLDKLKQNEEEHAALLLLQNGYEGWIALHEKKPEPVGADQEGVSRGTE